MPGPEHIVNNIVKMIVIILVIIILKYGDDQALLGVYNPLSL